MKILQRQITEAKKIGDVDSAKDLLVSLAQALGFAGKLDDALAALDEAEGLNASRDSFVPGNEVRLSTLVWVRGDSEAFGELTALKSTYIENGREWDAARVRMISVGFYPPCRLPKCSEGGQFARSVFDKYQDSYVVQLRNSIFFPRCRDFREMRMP